jgi:hypothetical protein
MPVKNASTCECFRFLGAPAISDKRVTTGLNAGRYCFFLPATQVEHRAFGALGLRARRCSARAGSASGGHRPDIRAGTRLSRAFSTASGGLARRQAGAVGDPKDVGIDGHGRLAEGGVEHHIGGLAPNPGQGFELGTMSGTSPLCFSIRIPTGRDDVLGLAVEQADGLDVLLQAVLAQGQDCSGVLATGNRRAVALLTPTSVACADKVTATSNSNGRRIVEFGLGFGIDFGQAPEEFLRVGQRS